MQKKTYLLLFSLLLCYMGYSQEIVDTDPTYFTVRYNKISSYIQWSGKEYQDIAFIHDSLTQTDGLPLKVKTKGYEKISNNEFTPFLLDTMNRNSSGYLYFFANPSYFAWLRDADATLSSSKVVVGQLKEKIKIDKESVRELFHLLIQFGVIKTYFHLYAELIITKMVEYDAQIEISYKCLFHYCTSQCYHPKYSFQLQFNKSTKEILLIK